MTERTTASRGRLGRAAAIAMLAALAGCNVQATATTPKGSPRAIGGDVLRNAVESDQARLNQQLETEIQARGGKSDDVRAASIKTDLGDALPAGAVTTCGSTLCRLETNHANEVVYRDFVRKTFIGFGAAWQGPFTIATVPPPSTDPKGAPVKSVIFLGENNKRKFPLPVNDDCGGCANAGQTRPGLSSLGPREESTTPPAASPATRKP